MSRERATERVELKLTKTQKARWRHIAREQGLTMTALVARAVEALAHRGKDSTLADLGREVSRLVTQHKHRR